ncbi:MAG TPA: hypothetical protein PLE70_08530, partial [Methanolinea sp.]|nr:hypothetical protein [Methanolinea sp.]
MTGITATLILVAGLLVLTVLPACAGDSVTVEVSRIPLVFIENQGQRPAEVLYHTNAAGHSIYFTQDAVVCVRAAGEDQAASVIEITVAGQSAGTEVTGEDPLTGTANFLIGNDP